jgi:glyoxylase-like metal-dependent hydrolase (beta-lactamase superfamily II)
MIRLHKLVFNSFQVNTFILYDETNRCVIIDPANYDADENEELADFIDRHNLEPELHLNTHCHVDHVLGMHFVRERFKIPSLAHKEELSLLERGPLMGEVFGFKLEPLPEPDRFISHNEEIEFGHSTLRAIHVPGHSAGSLAFYAEQEKLLVAGDALFAGSIGRTDLPGGDYDTLINSISQQLLTLPPETTVWPGHGPSTTIAEEIAHNPFFNDYKT